MIPQSGVFKYRLFAGALLQCLSRYRPYYYGNNGGELGVRALSSRQEPIRDAIVIALNSDQQVIPDADHGLKIQTTASDLASRPPFIRMKAEERRYSRIHARRQKRGAIPTDAEKPGLVIDPVLSHTSVVGGNDEDAVTGIAVDNTEVFSCRLHGVSQFPLENPYQSADCSAKLALYCCFCGKDQRALGTALLYSTYLGGPLTVGSINCRR
jgi:hypothetical protein